MLSLNRGRIHQIIDKRPGISKLLVELDGKIERAVNYDYLTGTPNINDKVILNTTAVELGLGSGGYHFVIANLSTEAIMDQSPGHIMKLRYTPWQLKVLSVEEPLSPFREKMENCSGLKGTPVVVGLLHSHLAPVVLALNWVSKGNLKVVYLMTDGGALPIMFSDQVEYLKQNNLLAGTITIGHAFGGDLEAVNIYSGLLAAKSVFDADVIIVCMGPGIVGTGTKWGFSGAEQGEIINAAAILGGQPVAVPRISFTDRRQRHNGLSHHSLTILGRIALATAFVGLPELPDEQMNVIRRQVEDAGLLLRHRFVIKNNSFLQEEIVKNKIELSSMGRSYQEDRPFFDAASASGLVAFDLLPRLVKV